MVIRHNAIVINFGNIFISINGISSPPSNNNQEGLPLPDHLLLISSKQLLLQFRRLTTFSWIAAKLSLTSSGVYSSKNLLYASPTPPSGIPSVSLVPHGTSPFGVHFEEAVHGVVNILEHGGQDDRCLLRIGFFNDQTPDRSQRQSPICLLLLLHRRHLRRCRQQPGRQYLRPAGTW